MGSYRRSKIPIYSISTRAINKSFKHNIDVSLICNNLHSDRFYIICPTAPSLPPNPHNTHCQRGPSGQTNIVNNINYINNKQITDSRFVLWRQVLGSSMRFLLCILLALAVVSHFLPLTYDLTLVMTLRFLFAVAFAGRSKRHSWWTK